MLTFDLPRVFRARQITKPYTFLVKAGFPPNTATRILNGKMRVLKLDHIEILCRELHCQPNDLIYYLEPENKKLGEDHPLSKLKPRKVDLDWQQQLKTMPLDRLNEISALINAPKEP